MTGTCPKCGVFDGQPCLSGTGRVVEMHEQRSDGGRAARAERQRQQREAYRARKEQRA